MQLISPEFFLFFALTLVLYNLFPQRARWWVLLFASLLFFLSAGIFAFIYMILISLSSYCLGLILQGQKKEGSRFGILLSLYSGVALVLGAWVILKLLPRGEISLPLGISFYTLRVISYLVDIKRRGGSAERSLFRYLLFVSYFPVALQGPIMRYGELEDTLYSGRRASGEERVSGLILMLWGVFKKLVVANALALPVSVLVGNTEKYTGAYVLLLLCLYTAEIYCDFSGGIDIVRGASFMLGIPLKRNFDRPFSSLTLREFWNRWHISLGEWFEHYVFYPLSLSRPMQRLSRWARARLGGKRGRKIPLYIATMTTWLLTGLWHGARANFVAWGLINGGLVLLSLEISPIAERLRTRHPAHLQNAERLCTRHTVHPENVKRLRTRHPSPIPNAALRTALARTRVFLIVGAVRLLDVYGSVGLTFRMLGTLLYDFNSYGILLGEIFALIPPPELVATIIALVAVYAIGRFNIRAENVAKSPSLAAVAVFSLALLSLSLGRYGMGFDAGDFIYSRF